MINIGLMSLSLRQQSKLQKKKLKKKLINLNNKDKKNAKYYPIEITTHPFSQRLNFTLDERGR